MKKSIYLIVGVALLLCHLSSAESLPSHVRRSSILAAVGGSCTRYSCATNKGFEQCLLEGGLYTSMASYTHEELKALLKVKRLHPNCYKSFCIANCMTPPGIEENPVDARTQCCSEGEGTYFKVKKRSDLCGKISKLKEKKRNSYIEKMDQFIETKMENCTQGDQDELKGLGGILRRMCYFCGPLLGAEGYRIIRACKARKGDFPNNVEQRIGQLSKRDIGLNQNSSANTLQLMRQIGVSTLQSAVSGVREQGSAVFNQARGYGADQGRGLHNLVQEHMRGASNQAAKARNRAFKEAQGFGKRASGLASGLTGDIQREKRKLEKDFAEKQKAIKAKSQKINFWPQEAREAARNRLRRESNALQERYEEELRDLEEKGSEDEGEQVGDLDVDLEGFNDESDD